METERWVPGALAPTGARLDDRQRLACLHRVLAATGFNENMAGHVTMAVGDGTDAMWASPWGLWWDEVRASDLCLVDGDGQVVEARARGGEGSGHPPLGLHGGTVLRPPGGRGRFRAA